MRAHVVVHRNPFDRLDRVVEEVRRPVKVRRLAPTGRPVVARLNGRWILRSEWRRKLRDGDHLQFVVLPQGGKSNGGGSNPLQTVLSLALMAFAPIAAGALLGTTTALVGTTLIGQITTSAIMLAGSALVSALLPVQSSQAQSLSLPTPSPTYSLTAQGNSARLEQPIPVQYGRMRFTPDFAAQPYTEYAGSDQYLYQLFCLGQGEFDVEQIQIDDTDIGSFAEVSTELIAPGGTVTLFPTAVVSSSEVGGQEMMGATTATYAQTGATIIVTETAHGRAAGQAVALDFTSGTATDAVFVIATVPTADTFTVTAASATTSGNVTVRSVIGGGNGFVALGEGKVTRRIAIDVVLSRGLFGSSGSVIVSKSISWTVEALQIDDFGAAIGGWTTLGSETITDATTTPIRRSYAYALGAAGRYAVRVYRTDAKDTSAGSGHEILWSAMRSYLEEPATYGAVSLLAIRMRATNNLSIQAQRLIRVTATRKVPIWDGSTWSAPTASRSIAWAIADVFRNSVYGAGRADGQIDLAALLALDATWTARGDLFDGRFDQSATFWDAMTRICAAGRAKPFLQGGVLRIVRDDARTVPVAMFSMRNIVRGSFSIDYLLPTDDTADAVQVSYFDGSTWSAQRVTASLPGSTAAKPVKVEVFGVTTRSQAMREGMYLAACNRYRRRMVRFSTEMEGFIPAIGDLIAVQHDVVGWGAQAEAISYADSTRTLTLSEPMAFTGATAYLAMRRKDGSISGPWQVRPGATPYSVVFVMAPDMTPYTDSDYDRTHCTFGDGSSWSTLAKVMSIRPRGQYLCDIEAVIEDPSVHTAETGIVAPPISLSNLPKLPTRPQMKGFGAQIHPLDATRIMLSWEPVPGATSYNIEVAEGSDPFSYVGSWTRVADTTASQFTMTILSSSQTLVRIRAVGTAAGDWSAAALGSLLARFWSTSPTAALWTTGTDPFWRPL